MLFFVNCVTHTLFLKSNSTVKQVINFHLITLIRFKIISNNSYALPMMQLLSWYYKRQTLVNRASTFHLLSVCFIQINRKISQTTQTRLIFRIVN